MLRADLDSLHHKAILLVAEHGARIRDRDVVKRCFATIRDRANDPNYKRHRMSTNQPEIIRDAWSIAALEGAGEARGLLGIAARQRSRRRAGEVLAIAGSELRRVDDARRIRELLGLAVEAAEGDGPLFTFEDLAPLVREATLHAIERGFSLPRGVEVLADHPLIQIHGKLSGSGSLELPAVRFPEPLDSRSRELGYSERIDRQVEFFRDAFYAFLANRLRDRGESNVEWIERRWDFPWVERFLPQLDDAAKEFATSLSSGRAVQHSWLFEFLQAVPRPEFKGNSNVDEVRVAASAAHAMTALGFDLTLMQQASGRTVRITEADLEVLRRSEYCLFEEWLDAYASLGRSLLDSSALAKLLCEEERGLASTITHINERAKQFSILASVAAVHRWTDDAKRLVMLASECIVAHGNHKDLLIYNAMMAVSSLCKHIKGPDRPAHNHIRKWLDALAGPIAYIGDYTDGDETGQLPHDFAAVLADNAPEVLPPYYEWLTGREEYDEAISAFAQFLRSAELKSASSLAVARTAVERKARAVLEDRAAGGDDAAHSCLEAIDAQFGSPTAPRLPKSDSAPRVGNKAEPSPLPSPADFPPPRLDEFLGALGDRFGERERATDVWAEHWESAGLEESVVDAFEKAVERGHWIRSLEAPYRISRNLGDRDQAFLWLVRAHREQSGWYWMHNPEEHAEKRWDEVRKHFSGRWLEFIRDTVRSSRDPLDTSEPWRGTSLGHGAFPRLVRYCLILDQPTHAIHLVDAIVRYSVEYVTPASLPDLPWVGCTLAHDESELALDLLFTRLAWPSGLVRERVSDAVASLLGDLRYKDEMHRRLLEWLRTNDLESTSVLGLLPFIRRGSEGADAATVREELRSSLVAPSFLSDVILQELAPSAEFAPSRLSHSGDFPADFRPDRFFVRHVRNFLPPIYWSRASRLEELGARGFRMQWAYEWKQLIAETRVEQSTSVLDYLYGSSAFKEPHRAADPRMSEVFRSAYLRALAWAVGRGCMPLEGAVFLAGEACPIDAELWKLSPGRRPEWWSRIEPDSGPIDTTISKLLALVEALRTSERRGSAPWGAEWTLAHANGRIASGEAIYDVEVVSFLQRASGRRTPPPETVTSWLLELRSEHESESPIAFRGLLSAVQADDVARSFDDWMVLPLAAGAVASYPVRWQWWRLFRPVWLPFVYHEGSSCSFSIERDALCVRRGSEVVAKWSDWTDGVEEVLNIDLAPPSGSALFIKSEMVDALAARARASTAWAVRVKCLHRESPYKSFETHVHDALLGGSNIITSS